MWTLNVPARSLVHRDQQVVLFSYPILIGYFQVSHSTVPLAAQRRLFYSDAWFAYGAILTCQNKNSFICKITQALRCSSSNPAHWDPLGWKEPQELSHPTLGSNQSPLNSEQLAQSLDQLAAGNLQEQAIHRLHGTLSQNVIIHCRLY